MTRIQAPQIQAPQIQAPHMLQTALSRMLPDARLATVSLPLCPEIKLWLLAGEVLERPLTADEHISIQAHPCYWAVCWASGHRLASYLLQHPHQVAGKTVIDVGCGSGVVAIAASLAGAKQVIACDLDPEALIATRENALLNQVDLTLLDNFFDWMPADSAEHPALIIAADLLYDRSNLPLIDAFLQKSSDVLIADSRIQDFSHPAFRQIDRLASSNEPQSSGYDEFTTMCLYQTINTGIKR